jgi:hypothetical protein
MEHYTFMPRITESAEGLKSAAMSAHPLQVRIATELCQLLGAELESRRISITPESVRREYGGMWRTDDMRLMSVLFELVRIVGRPSGWAYQLAVEGGEDAVNLAVSLLLAYAKEQRSQGYKRIAKVAGAGLLGGFLGATFG